MIGYKKIVFGLLVLMGSLSVQAADYLDLFCVTLKTKVMSLVNQGHEGFALIDICPCGEDEHIEVLVSYDEGIYTANVYYPFYESPGVVDPTRDSIRTKQATKFPAKWIKKTLVKLIKKQHLVDDKG